MGEGEYLTESVANIMLCEIKSDQFCKSLIHYNVKFWPTDFTFEEEKSIFHISVERGHFLPALKTFHALQKQTTLFVNPGDGLEEYKQAIDAFRLPKYNWLVLIFHTNINHNLVSEIFFKLKDILDAGSNKKVLLIGNKQNVQQDVLKNNIFEIDGSVKFSNLTETCQESLVRKENINYQGKRTTLQELLGSSLGEDYDRALDAEGLEKLVKGEEIRVGTSLDTLDSDIMNYYINRTIERDTDEMENEMRSVIRKNRFTEEDIFEVEEKFIIISDCAGMGKSTVLAKLAQNMKEKYPHLWVIRIELNNYSSILRDSRRKKKCTIDITEFLNSNEATRFNNLLERFIFSMNKKVVIIFDGFDEISPDYTELVLNLLSQCQEGANFAKVFVTTRPHMNRELGDLLKVKPFLLQPFTTEDQIVFLVNYWRHHLGLDDSNTDKCLEYAMSLITKMSFWVNSKYNFTAIPLQVRMLAEIFQKKENDTVEWEGCEEFLVGAKQEPELPERMKICELYEMFIEKKWNILLDKVNPAGSISGNELLSDKCFINHQNLALQDILYNEFVHDKGIRHIFSRFQYDKNMEPRMLKIGIVQMMNGKLEFVHRTFSEYFVAKSILEISELGQGTFNQDVVFQQFFIDEILCNPQFMIVHNFLESALEGIVDSLPANIFEKYQNFATADPKSQQQRSQILHLLAFEGNLSIFKLILKSIDIRNISKTFKDDGDNTLKLLQGLIEKHGIEIKDESGDTLLLCAVTGGHLNMIKYLVEQGASTSTRTGKGLSVMHVAARTGLSEVYNFLDVVDVNLCDNSGRTALHFASFQGHLDMVKWLVECKHADVSVADNDGVTAFYTAAHEGHLNICKFLVRKGVEVDLHNKNGHTALHAASIIGHSHVVKWLVECGHVDINAADNDGFTALHCAAEKGHLEICKLLLEGGLDANLCNKNGVSALHSAAEKGQADVVKWLVEYAYEDVNVTGIVECGRANINVADNDGFTTLHFAAEEGHLDVCKMLLEGGVDANLRNEVGASALHSASLKGNSEVVKWLVECGHVDVNVVDNDGFTALQIAAEEGHLVVCKLLLEGGVDANLRNKVGASALHSASLKGNSDVVKWLVECKHVDVNVADSDGFTALHVAAQEGYLVVCNLLLEGGVDVNLRSKTSLSALHSASIKGHTDVVKWILECGDADVNLADNCDFTALHFAADEGHLDVCRLLVEKGVDTNLRSKTGFSALCLASLMGHSDVVKWLVQCGHADVNVADNDGLTALHYASQESHMNICKLLLEGSIDPNLRNTDGVTALHLASIQGHSEVVKWLVECGHANVNITCNYGFTALHTAVEGGHLDVCKLLLEAGVDANLRNADGDTALQSASGGGHIDIVKWLVECGHVDINIADNDGVTALHTAVEEGHLDVCKFLLEAGADVNIRDKKCVSALDSAALKGHSEVVKLLVECGQSDVTVADSDGLTALHWAAQGGHLDVCKFLVEGGVDVNTRHKIGFTALHLAVMEGHLDVTKFLVAAGADVNSRSSHGFTPLRAAIQYGHQPIIEFFDEIGKEINAGHNNS